MSYQSAPYQLILLNLVYYEYYKNNKKRIYQVYRKALTDQQKDFYIIFEAGIENIVYFNKSFDKLIINCMRIDMVS